jgi:transcription elongation factor GreA
MAAYPEYTRLGATIVVRDIEGERETYVVVAPREADPRAGRVSSESPIGRALLGRRVGESVVIRAPGGSFDVTIESVELPATDTANREQA